MENISVFSFCKFDKNEGIKILFLNSICGLMIEEKIRKNLEKSGYRFVGKFKHSANKICEWTKKSLRGEGFCYKQKWYGIESHRCLQCTLSLICNTRCIYCWRSFKAFIGNEMNNFTIDEPDKIIEGLIEAQRKLLSGFKGYEKVDKKKWKEAQNPTNFAISLVGESLFYPKISEFIKKIHQRNGSTFLVTKGTLPKQLENLEEEPTNLYISLCAPDKKTFMKIDRPIISNAWEKQMKSLELMNSFKCRKVIRITSVKGWNMKNPKKYAKLIEIANPDFIEVKAYMHVGESQKRLPRSAMPLMEDVTKFARKIATETEYIYKDEFKPSRVVLLSKK